MLPVVVHTDNYALIEKWRSRTLYDSDIHVLRYWDWLMANEPGIQFEFVPESQNTGADLLSRPVSERGVNNTFRPILEVNQISVWDEIWAEQMNSRWGARRTLWALQKKGSQCFLEDCSTGL